MSKKEVIKEVAISGKNQIYINLPVPDETVLLAYIDKSENPDVVVDRYLTIVKETSILEAKTIVESVKAKYSFYWKIIAILAALMFLITGILIGSKIKLSWDKASVECSQNK